MYTENSKISICLDSFSKQIYNIWVNFRLLSVFETTRILKLPIKSIYHLLFSRSYRVTDEPRYGPSPAFLMNIFFPLKGSKLFFSYSSHNIKTGCGFVHLFGLLFWHFLPGLQGHSLIRHIIPNMWIWPIFFSLSLQLIEMDFKYCLIF